MIQILTSIRSSNLNKKSIEIRTEIRYISPVPGAEKIESRLW